MVLSIFTQLANLAMKQLTSYHYMLKQWTWYIHKLRQQSQRLQNSIYLFNYYLKQLLEKWLRLYIWYVDDTVLLLSSTIMRHESWDTNSSHKNGDNEFKKAMRKFARNHTHVIRNTIIWFVLWVLVYTIYICVCVIIAIMCI